MTKQRIPRLGCTLWFLAFSTAAGAAEFAGLDWSGSGFATVAIGKMLNGVPTQMQSGYACPCFVSDFAQGGVYQQGGLQWQPDSKVGWQGKASLNPDFSVTGQVVMRAAAGGHVDFEWLYGNWRLNEQFSLQIGRKRLPLLYYSESQDVGFAYPWVHLSPQIYGWEIVNFNGANLAYQGQWGDWSSSVDLFTGSETVRNSNYWQMYNGRYTRTDSRWRNLLGADVSLSKDALEIRLAMMQSELANTNPKAANPLAFGPATPQYIYSASLHYEAAHWLIHGGLLYINRKASYGEDFSRSFAVGYRIGNYLPMLSHNRYYQKQHYAPALGLSPAQAEAHHNTALSLRYELTPASALKLQYDHWQNDAQPAFFIANPNSAVPMGSSSLLSMSYDLLF